MVKVIAPVLAFLVLLSSTACLAGQPSVLSEPPKNPKKEQRFMFYMHGAWIERAGLNEPHPKYGRYEYEKIVKAFSDKGFTVISEVRTKRVNPEAYSRKIVGQINELLQKGVPPENITVTGHSKGGHMALLVATMLSQPKVNFVIMAGGGRKGTRFGVGFQRFVNRHGPLSHLPPLHGRPGQIRLAGCPKTIICPVLLQDYPPPVVRWKRRKA